MTRKRSNAKGITSPGTSNTGVDTRLLVALHQQNGKEWLRNSSQSRSTTKSLTLSLICLATFLVCSIQLSLREETSPLSSTGNLQRPIEGQEADTSTMAHGNRRNLQSFYKAAKDQETRRISPGILSIFDRFEESYQSFRQTIHHNFSDLVNTPRMAHGKHKCFFHSSSTAGAQKETYGVIAWRKDTFNQSREIYRNILCSREYGRYLTEKYPLIKDKKNTTSTTAFEPHQTTTFARTLSILDKQDFPPRIFQLNTTEWRRIPMLNTSQFIIAAPIRQAPTNPSLLIRDFLFARAHPISNLVYYIKQQNYSQPETITFLSTLVGELENQVSLVSKEPLLAIDFQVLMDHQGHLWQFDLDRVLSMDDSSHLLINKAFCRSVATLWYWRESAQVLLQKVHLHPWSKDDWPNMAQQVDAIRSTPIQFCSKRQMRQLRRQACLNETTSGLQNNSSGKHSSSSSNNDPFGCSRAWDLLYQLSQQEKGEENRTGDFLMSSSSHTINSSSSLEQQQAERLCSKLFRVPTRRIQQHESSSSRRRTAHDNDASPLFANRPLWRHLSIPMLRRMIRHESAPQ